MADPVYMPDPWSALAAQHSDIRREGSVERGDIRRETADMRHWHMPVRVS